MSMFEDFSNNSIKVSTKEELVQLLKEYDGILSNYMIDYFRSLIELEFSVVRNNISDSERLGISQLEIYKKVAIYNIYNRALNIFKQNDKEFEISVNEDERYYLKLRLSVLVPLSNKSVKLFDFNWNSIDFVDSISDDYKSFFNTNEINLYKIVEDKELINQEIRRTQGILDELYDCVPFYDLGNRRMNTAEKINEYENIQFECCRQLDYLEDDEKREIEVTTCIHNLLLEDYGLTEDDFTPEESFTNPVFKSKLEKTLVKKLPNLVIKNNIRYI